jgi:Plastocyanin
MRRKFERHDHRSGHLGPAGRHRDGRGDAGSYVHTESVTIAVGGTVTVDFGSVAHNVFFDNAPAGAPANITAATSNASMALTFNQAGTFVYNCHIHPGMHGTVVVK